MTTWARSIEVDGERGVIALLAPTGDTAWLGRDPAVPWRYLAEVAVGIADTDFVISQVSADITNVLGGAVADWEGVSLVELMHPDDAPRFRRLTTAHDDVSGIHGVRFRRQDGSWAPACLMLAVSPARPDRVLFALVGPRLRRSDPADRAAELESRLRRIGLEVRAAGVLDRLASYPAAPGARPELAELTTRQWEILSRLRAGDRVPTIAADLYISASTVRNHLATIFRKFGVHSQAELLKRLRQ